MNRQELAARTNKFAVNVFKFCEGLPGTIAANVVVNQLLRSASSVAANYRAALRAKSERDFLNKLKIVLEESDESSFWLTFASDVKLARTDNLELVALIDESNQLTAIFTASVRTISQRNQKSKILNHKS